MVSVYYGNICSIFNSLNIIYEKPNLKWFSRVGYIAYIGFPAATEGTVEQHSVEARNGRNHIEIGVWHFPYFLLVSELESFKKHTSDNKHPHTVRVP